MGQRKPLPASANGNLKPYPCHRFVLRYGYDSMDRISQKITGSEGRNLYLQCPKRDFRMTDGEEREYGPVCPYLKRAACSTTDALEMKQNINTMSVTVSLNPPVYVA